MATQQINTSASRLASRLSTAQRQLSQALQEFRDIGNQLASASSAAERQSLAGISSGGDTLRDQVVGLAELYDTAGLSDAEIKTRAQYIQTIITEYV